MDSRPLTLTELLEYRRRMLLSEVEWIECVLCTEPKTAELRQAWKRRAREVDLEGARRCGVDTQ